MTERLAAKGVKSNIGTYCVAGAHDRCKTPGRCDCECHRRHEMDPKRPAASSGDILWEEPPVHARARRSLQELRPIIVELKRNPKRWARVRSYPGRTSATASVKKLRDEFPDCEFKAARLPESGSAIWGRFLETD